MAMLDPAPATLSDFELVASLTTAEREALFERLGAAGLIHFMQQWRHRARPAQLPPEGDWRLWLILAGRGFGKTRAGAEWVRSIAESVSDARIALIGSSINDARQVMVEGESGLLAIAPPTFRPEWRPARRMLRWPNGAVATLYGAAQPDALRGPQHSHMWGDEIAKWAQGCAAWDNAMMGLRLGERPQALATTTPRPVPLVRRLVAAPEVVVTRGRTQDNRAHLPTAFLEAMERDYGSGRLGRQELGGELIETAEGALWSYDLIESCIVDCGVVPALARVVVGVDPPASADGDACGIVVAALDSGGMAWILDDASVERASPERWARAVAAASERWGADRVIAEANNGGAMVESVLRAVDASLPVKLVHAARGKSARAEPVAALYEAGRVRHCRRFDRLHEEMCGLLIGGGYEGPGRSPDRADALVWALTHLIGPGKGQPRLRAC